MWKQLPEATRNVLCREVPTSAPEASLERVMRDFIHCQLSFRSTGAMGGLLTIFTEANCSRALFELGSCTLMKHSCLKEQLHLM